MDFYIVACMASRQHPAGLPTNVLHEVHKYSQNPHTSEQQTVLSEHPWVKRASKEYAKRDGVEHARAFREKMVCTICKTKL